MSYADLREANLTGAKLDKAHLHQANLSGATLWKTYMTRAILTNADLRGTDLTGAILDGADMEYAKLPGESEEKTSEKSFDIIAYARNVAKVNLGEGVIVSTAQADRIYEGEILSIHEEADSKLVVMALAEDRVIIHDMKDTDGISALEEGKTATFVTDSEGRSAVRGMDAETERLEQTREGKGR
jgi:hypothetical protein